MRRGGGGGEPTRKPKRLWASTGNSGAAVVVAGRRGVAHGKERAESVGWVQKTMLGCSTNILYYSNNNKALLL